ncbi:MAG TPA: hypothetical protein PLZ45_03080 [Ferruginibacter sp.]|nr:hypothetical protein [Chitinophagaceae bacterium]HRI23629.1 hypothetical protein [Ferruginibacter sp.]
MTGKISAYIKEQTCASICCVTEEGLPYCFSCYYVYNSGEFLLHYKSAAATQHSQLLLKNPAVAGTILPDKLSALHIKGLQFTGTVLPADHPSAMSALSFYHRKNPLALAIPGNVYTIRIDTVKYTDSSLGFGKKLNWNRSEATVEQ